MFKWRGTIKDINELYILYRICGAVRGFPKDLIKTDAPDFISVKSSDGIPFLGIELTQAIDSFEKEYLTDDMPDTHCFRDIVNREYEHHGIMMFADSTDSSKTFCYRPFDRILTKSDSFNDQIYLEYDRLSESDKQKLSESVLIAAWRCELDNPYAFERLIMAEFNEKLGCLSGYRPCAHYWLVILSIHHIDLSSDTTSRVRDAMICLQRDWGRSFNRVLIPNYQGVLDFDLVSRRILLHPFRSDVSLEDFHSRVSGSMIKEGFHTCDVLQGLEGSESKDITNGVSPIPFDA